MINLNSIRSLLGSSFKYLSIACHQGDNVDKFIDFHFRDNLRFQHFFLVFILFFSKMLFVRLCPLYMFVGECPARSWQSMQDANQFIQIGRFLYVFLLGKHISIK